MLGDMLAPHSRSASKTARGEDAKVIKCGNLMQRVYSVKSKRWIVHIQDLQNGLPKK